MRRITAVLLVLLLAGCGAGSPPDEAATPPGAEAGATGVEAAQPPPGAGSDVGTPAGDSGFSAAPPPLDAGTDPAAPPRPDPEPALLRGNHPRKRSPEEVREGLAELVNLPGTTPAQQLQALFDRWESLRRRDTLPWLEADLDADGQMEFAVALPFTDPTAADYLQGLTGGLFIIDRRDGAYVVERSTPLPPLYERELMVPTLHGAADLTGAGRPQIIWSRPWMIASGPQPHAVLVTAWEPGRFTHLPGEMHIVIRKRTEAVVLDGQDLLLTGGSREALFMRTRTDRYRFVDGAFRLVDRRFTEPGQTAYDRLWDGLVAESVGRTADAEAAYRQALEPSLPAHEGSVMRYNAPPIDLTPEDLTALGDGVRALARFRLGGLVLAEGRPHEAEAALADGAEGRFAGLTEAMRGAASREAGCEAGAAWAEAHPAFLQALNLGASDHAWTPQDLCAHPAIADTLLP